MTSNGQRFRRRSLRRGYKVDEVDTFLDRVEATLNGESLASPVRSQEVHDVVFRVRFGGYDEWQVDLHLDRVERQLADQEGTLGDRLGGARPPAERGPGDRGPDRMPERLGPDPRGGRMGDSMADRMMPPQGPGQPPMAPPLPTRSPMNSGMAGPQAAQAGFGQYDEATGYLASGNRPQAGPPTGPMPPATPGNYGPPQGPAGYDASRHGRMDMTTEMRMPDMRTTPPPGAPGMPPQERPGPPPAANKPPAAMPPPPNASSHTGTMPLTPPAGPPPGMGGAPTGGGFASTSEVQRIDQMRRAFQPRRFGSGYDRMEVDRLFEGIMAAMSGRGTMPVDERELDPGQFNLVPGGYFEAEVDQALREVRDILRRS